MFDNFIGEMNHHFSMGRLLSLIGSFLIGLGIYAVLTHPVHAQGAGVFSSETSALSATRNVAPGYAPNKNPAVQNLGYLVNSRFDDLNPIITADGSTIYFARKYSIENIGGKADPQDIWKTTQMNGKWTTSRNLGRDVNTPKADNLCGVSADQQTLYFFIQSSKQRGYFGFREKSGSTWSKMQPTGLEIENESHFLEASMAMNGDVFLFTARNSGNLYYRSASDERDIFVSFKLDDRSWSDPINLGPSINSSGDEYSPFLAADGKTLYFSSNGRPGMGGVDIFMARRTGPGWTEWTEPVNLGPQINSSGFDGYLTIPASGDVAYLASSRLSLGKADLVKVALPGDLQPGKVIELKGVVRNAETGREMVGHISIAAQNSHGLTSHESQSSGAYTSFVPAGSEIFVEARAEGFLTQRRSFHTGHDASTILIDFSLVPAGVGEYLDPGPIYFKEGRAELIPESLTALDSLSEMLLENPMLTIRVEGHTDNRGDRKSLYDLSRKRVQAVQNYLVGAGIAPKRVSVKALGPSVPAADNATDESRSKNRRVEFRVVRR